MGIPYANREDPLTHDVVGYFVNMMIVPLTMATTSNFRETVIATNTAINSALEHSVVPMMTILEAVAPRVSGPLFQTMMRWEEAEGWGAGMEMKGLQDIPMVGPPLTQMYDGIHLELNISGRGEDGTMAGTINYSSQLYSHQTMERLGKSWVRLLGKMVEEPDTPLAQLNGMPDAEASMIVHEWNDTARPYDKSATMHRMFEEQALRTPDLVALVYAGYQVS